MAATLTGTVVTGTVVTAGGVVVDAGALKVIDDLNPRPLTGANNDKVCAPLASPAGRLPVIVTEPVALAVPVAITVGVLATTNCTVSNGTKPR